MVIFREVSFKRFMKLIRVCVGDWSVFEVFRVCINYGDGEKIRKLVREVCILVVLKR